MSKVEKFIIARWMYAIGEEFIGDIEYDQLYEELKDLPEVQEYYQHSWSSDTCPVELLKKYGYESAIKKVEITANSESIPSINVLSKAEDFIKYCSYPVRVSMKHDGWNTEVNYYNGKYISSNTRGRKTNEPIYNEVIKHIVPNEIPFKGKVKIVGECTLKKDRWEEYKELTGNKSIRSSVSSVIARGDFEFIQFHAFKILTGENDITDQYNVLNSLGIQTPRFIDVNNSSELMAAVIKLGKINKVYNAPTDGVVIEGSGFQRALRIHEWQEEELCSFVTGYVENPGLYSVSMVCKIHPVLHEGRTISEVSVTNLAYIIENNLKKGYPIAFDIRSSAVAVLNTSRTQELQEEWKDREEEFVQNIIDKDE